jgi:DNA-binding Xre family transcriptional regulator
MAKAINQVLAANLAFFMRQRGIASQTALAKKSGIAQRTIGNYLRPDLRQVSKSGKMPSAKLSELETIAAALDVQVWDLLRDMTPSERAFYAKLEAAYRKLVPEEITAAELPSPPPPPPASPTVIPLSTRGRRLDVESGRLGGLSALSGKQPAKTPRKGRGRK